MKLFKVIVMVAGLVGFCCSSAYAASGVGPIQVSAGVGEILEVSTAVIPQGTSSDQTALDFGGLVLEGQYVASTGWYEVQYTVNTNAPAWTLNSNASALTSGTDTLPIGALQVTGPTTGGNVDANTGVDIDVANNTNSSAGNVMTIVYSMPADKVPVTQPDGDYSGTVTLTVTTT